MFVPSRLCEPTLHRRLPRPTPFSLTIIWSNSKTFSSFHMRSTFPFTRKIKKRLRQGRGWSWDYRWGYCLLTCQVLQTSATFDIRRMGSNTKTSFRCTWVDKSYWAKADGDLTAKMSMLVTDYKCDPSRNKKKYEQGSVEEQIWRRFKTLAGTVVHRSKEIHTCVQAYAACLSRPNLSCHCGTPACIEYIVNWRERIKWW